MDKAITLWIVGRLSVTLRWLRLACLGWLIILSPLAEAQFTQPAAPRRISNVMANDASELSASPVSTWNDRTAPPDDRNVAPPPASVQSNWSLNPPVAHQNESHQPRPLSITPANGATRSEFTLASTANARIGNARTTSDAVVTASATEPIPVPPNQAEPRLRLKPSANVNAIDKAENTRSSLGPFVTMVVSLLLVLGLFLTVAWLFRRTTRPIASLPKEVVQVMGKTQIGPRHQLHVIRFGRKLLLISNQQGQFQTLSEVDDETEVERLAGLCEQKTETSITNSFRQVFQQVARQDVMPLEPPSNAAKRRQSRTSFDYIS